MKVNILFTIQEMAARRAQAGNEDPELHVRATGRTTGIALMAIGLAMQGPNHGKVFAIPRDHYNSGSCNSTDIVRRRMLDIAASLGIIGLSFNTKNMTYSYQVIYEV